MNITYDQILKKFRYPESVVSENDSWHTLLRMEQLTFGSLILITKDSKNVNFSMLDEKEQLDMFKAIKKIEEVGYQELEGREILTLDKFKQFGGPLNILTKVFSNGEEYDGMINEITKELYAEY